MNRLGNLFIFYTGRNRMNKILIYFLHQKVYRLLSKGYPNYIWYNEIEKVMKNDFNETKKLLFYWDEKGYLKKRDSKNAGFPDDMFYGLTAEGLDELSFCGQAKKLIPFIGQLKFK